MFDDQPTGAGAAPPGNLPMGEPEDIFASTEAPPPAAPPAPPAPPEPESPPAPAPPPESAAPTTQSAIGAGRLQPVQPETPASTPTPVEDLPAPPVAPAAAETMTVPPPEMPQMYQVQGPRLSRGLMLGIIISIAVLIVFGAGWWIYAAFVRDEAPEPATTLENTQPVPGPGTVDLPSVPPPTQPEPRELDRETIDSAVLFGEPIDSDDDQLEDELELTVGTNPDNWDTDGDGLSDGDELLVWETDPLNPDSDGDSYLDGQEIKAGYSPTGPGRLFEPPTTTPEDS